jgi:hypothetical protein
LPATSNQLQYLPDRQGDYSLTRYEASLLMVSQFNASKIKKALQAGSSR